MDDQNPTNDQDQQTSEEQPSQGIGYNNPSGCSQCSCKGYTQDHANICTCGHNSEAHTGNNA